MNMPEISIYLPKKNRWDAWKKNRWDAWKKTYLSSPTTWRSSWANITLNRMSIKHKLQINFSCGHSFRWKNIRNWKSNFQIFLDPHSCRKHPKEFTWVKTMHDHARQILANRIVLFDIWKKALSKYRCAIWLSYLRTVGTNSSFLTRWTLYTLEWRRGIPIR
jgi:hypothetical protein